MVDVSPSTGHLLATAYPPGVTQTGVIPAEYALRIAAGSPGTSHEAVSPRFNGFTPGQPFYLSFLYMGDRTTGVGVLNLKAQIRWYGTAGLISTTEQSINIDADTGGYVFAEKLHPAPAAAKEGEMVFLATPAASPMQHNLEVIGIRLGLTERGADTTLAIAGSASGVVYYESDGTTFDSGPTLSYRVQQQGVTLTSGVTMTYRVIEGTVNGLNNASGDQSLTLTSGVGTINVTAMTTPTARIQVNATYNGRAVTAFETTLTRTLLPPPTGGGGGGGGYPSSQSSGFAQIVSPWTTFVNIHGTTDRLQITMPTGKTTARITVSLSPQWWDSSQASYGPWNIEAKVQRNTGTTGSPTWTDIGSVQNSNPDPYLEDLEDPPMTVSQSGTISFTYDDTGRTAGVTYEYRIVSRVSSGTTTGNDGGPRFTSGSVALSAP